MKNNKKLNHKDAISIEWLVTWGRKYIMEAMAEDGVFSERAFIVAIALDKMRQDWLKENEEQHT